MIRNIFSILILFGLLGLMNVQAQSQNQIILIAESNSYTGPIYQGKALITWGSNVTIAALGPGVENEYRWQVGKRALPAQSGIGRNVLSMPASSSKLDVVVEAYTPNGQKIGRSSITINPTKPEILFYQDHPIRGPIYETTLPRSLVTTNESLTVKSIVHGANSNQPTVKWRFDNTPLPLGDQITIPKSSVGLIRELKALFNGGFNQSVDDELFITFK